jgi:hypothetical protein
VCVCVSEWVSEWLVRLWWVNAWVSDNMSVSEWECEVMDECVRWWISVCEMMDKCVWVSEWVSSCSYCTCKPYMYSNNVSDE